MQVMTLGTILPQVNTSFLPNEFSRISRSLGRKSHSTSLQPFINFRGQISVGKFSIPIQRFSLREKDNLVFIENFPKKSFPKIKIVLEEVNSIYNVKEFKVRPSDNSVQGEILYTRFFLLTANAKQCSLHFRDIDFIPFDFSFSDMTLEERRSISFRAKLFRKLGFLEEFFKINLAVPENITPNDLSQIELLFRGITESEFSLPVADSITIFNYKIKKEDLQDNITIPQKREFSFDFNENLLVLDRFFPIGKMTFKIKKGSIANPRSIIKFKENEIIPNLRLNVFDYQIYYHFEKYAQNDRLLKNKQKLIQFKTALLKEEPDFLANLLNEPLAEIDEKSAIEIVEGLLQYYDFPDRFSILKPTLEDNQWCVPIALTYPKHEPIFLEDAFVDVRTGKVKMKISFDELLTKGKQKAKEIFSIA